VLSTPSALNWVVSSIYTTVLNPSGTAAPVVMYTQSVVVAESLVSVAPASYLDLIASSSGI